MVEDHGAVATADKVVVAHGVVEFRWEDSGFEDCGDVVVAVRGMGLAGREMTVYETEGGIVDDESDYQCALQRVSNVGAEGEDFISV